MVRQVCNFLKLKINFLEISITIWCNYHTIILFAPLQIKKKRETGSPVWQSSPLKCWRIKILSGGTETFMDLQIFNFSVINLRLGQCQQLSWQ